MTDKMKKYRQALRDLPTHENWPDLQESDWPTLSQEIKMPYLGKQPVNVIKNNAVSTDTIVDDAVTNAKVAPSAINTTELADDAVQTAKINANAVTDAKLNDNAVTTNKIFDLNDSKGKLYSEEVIESKQKR